MRFRVTAQRRCVVPLPSTRWPASVGEELDVEKFETFAKALEYFTNRIKLNWSRVMLSDERTGVVYIRTTPDFEGLEK